MWRGTPAAVEVIALPAGQAACACDARHAAAALDEAARRTEGHPNIVQVRVFSDQPDLLVLFDFRMARARLVS